MKKMFFAALSLIILFDLSCTNPPNTGNTSDNPNPSLTQQNSSGLRINGKALLLAPLQNAHVLIERLPKDKNNKIEKVGETRTNDRGEFSFTLDSIDGDLLISVSGLGGGNTLEPLTSTEPIPLSLDDKFMALLIDTKLKQNIDGVRVNPWTTLIVTRTLYARQTSDIPLKQAFEENVLLFAEHFDNQPFWLASGDSLNGKELPSTLSADLIYYFNTMALSQHAMELGQRADIEDRSIINSLVLSKLLAKDISDGIFDGAYNEQPLNVSGNVFIEEETTRLFFADALETFLASDKNKTKLKTQDLTRILSSIRGDTSVLYKSKEPPQEKPPTTPSGVGPQIVILSPKPNETLNGQGTINGYAEDADGVASVNVAFDGQDVSDLSFDKAGNTKWAWNFKPALADGDHILTVTSQDSKSNRSKTEIHFSLKAAGPRINLVTCKANDDSSRSMSVSPAGVQFGAAQKETVCNDSTLSDGKQVFNVYPDLIATNTDSPTLLFDIDAGKVSSATYAVKKNDTVIQQVKPLPEFKTNPQASHTVNLSIPMLGPELGKLTADDTIQLEINAVDLIGNASSRTFKFKLNLLLVPFYVETQTTDPRYALTSFGFDKNNIENLFDTTYGLQYDLLHLAQYEITNPSRFDQTLVLDVRNTGLNFGGTTYHAYTTGTTSPSAYFDYNKSPIPDDIKNCDRYRETVTNGARSVTCLDNFNGSKIPHTFSAQLQVRIFDASGRALDLSSGNLTLPARQSAIMVIGTPRPSWQAAYHPSHGRVCSMNYLYYQPDPKDPDRYIDGNFPFYIANASQANGFIKRHEYYHDTNTEYMYGFISCNVNSYFPAWDDKLCPDYFVPMFLNSCLSARNELSGDYSIAGGYSRFSDTAGVVGDVYVEQDVTFSTGAAVHIWIKKPNNTTPYPAQSTGQSELSFTKSWSTTAPKPLWYVVDTNGW